MAKIYKASVIIPTKNPGPIFHKVLQAVCDQQTSFDFEILVIDSGSTDGTVEYVKKLNQPGLTIHEIPAAEFGHGKTRNLGVSLTSGEYAVLITHDACPVTDNWLESLVAAANQDENIAGVFGRHIAYVHSNLFTTRELEAHFSMFQSSPVASLDDPERYKVDESYRQLLHFFSDNNALIRRSVWEKIPYPDVDFAEDQIWAQKIIEAGYKKAYSHEAAVYHSHDFTLFERLQRSFDESYALYRLFGYRLCRGLIPLLSVWAVLSSRDTKYLIKTGQWKRKPQFLIWRPVDVFLKLVGHYLGARGDRIPAGIRNWLSRDKRMMSGMLANNGNAPV